MPTIVIIDCTKTQYDGDTLRLQPLGGIESATVNLAESLAKKGNSVSVINQCSTEKNINGVNWLPYVSSVPKSDVVIVNNNPNLFEKAIKQLDQGATPVIWFHNSVNLWKIIRKKRFSALWKWRPKAVFVGEFQKKKAGRFLPFRSSNVIGHGIDDIFFQINEKIISQAKRKPKAIFISQPYRGLKECISIWQKKIYPVSPDFEFHVFAGNKALSVIGQESDELIKQGIFIHDKVSKQEIMIELMDSRVMFYPGHSDETFCLAAAEAHACGTPVVTQGIGSLQERVTHKVNGYISKNDDQLAQYVIDIFKNDDLFDNLSKNALSMKSQYKWDIVSDIWQKYLFN